MAKKTSKKPTPVKKVDSKPLITWTPTREVLIAAGLFFILILIYFFPIVFENKIPPSSDIIAWKGNAHSILEARKQYSYTPLWANNVFSGMPAHLISLWPPFEQPARYLLDALAWVIKWQALYYLIGAVGMILLMRTLGVSTLPASFSAVAFVWWPNLVGLLEAGHNGKVQTILLMPLVIFLFLRWMRKADLLNFLLFTIGFSLAVRAGHYQIVFYLVLALCFFGVVELYRLFKEKRSSAAALRIVLTAVALGVGAAMSAFHVLQVQEYSKYSIRGGTGEEGSTGLDLDYATQWSLHPGEMYNFIIPRFWGGHSSQLYTGDAVPQLQNRVIPGYWGHMPFTSTTDYMGVVTIFFALAGIGLCLRRGEVKALTAMMLLSLLLAFGRHFPLVYRLFFDWVPFFNKFRVPTMIVVLVMFSVSVLAGFGLNAFMSRLKESETQKLLKTAAIIFGILALLGIAPLLLRQQLALLRPEEARSYNPEIIRLLKAARFDLLKGDALRMLALVTAAFAIVVAYLKKALSGTALAILILIVSLIDLLPICNRYMRDLVPQSEFDAYFRETEIDRVIRRDPEPHRVYPLGDLGGDAHWAYFHQSIEGYHPAKLRIYQDVRESCLLQGTDPEFGNTQLPINWNLVDMLNARYLISPQPLTHPRLDSIYYDPAQKLRVYRNRGALPRAFCVGKIEVIPERDRRLARLNQASFRPDSIAIVEKPVSAEIRTPSRWSAQVTRYEPNYIDLKVFSDQPTLLVLSEIYYPAGWKAVVNGRPTEIYKVNHILRGVVLPEGESTISFKLEPRSYKISVAMTGIANGIVYLLLIATLFPELRKRLAAAKGSAK
ncbi:MAG: YfhO family protein [candidate division KSB1 bacterium]|nr:YfhO family protein [candidate division KSB1 bacterium]MDZ7345339.1 YfhO family protein [candidate division KSB1 bacterium]